MPKAVILRQVLAGGRMLAQGSTVELDAAALKRLTARGLARALMPEPATKTEEKPAAKAEEPKTEPKTEPKASHKPARPVPEKDDGAKTGKAMTLDAATLTGAK